MWFGKIIGAILGFAVLGPLGLVAGIFLGHFFDKSLSQFRPSLSVEERARAEELFFETVFKLMGFIAKADGRVSEEEVAQAEQHMAQMNLHPDLRSQAIDYFKVGASGEFEMDELLTRFNTIARRLPSLRQTVITYVINIALADGKLDPAEETALSRIAQALGFSAFAFKHLLAMLRAQANFQQQGQGGYRQQGAYQQPTRADELKLAYEALGVEPDVTDAALKKAYRKLMSENHPDKLMGQGVPKDMVDLATERAKNIQTAYDLIKKHRKSTHA